MTQHYNFFGFKHIVSITVVLISLYNFISSDPKMNYRCVTLWCHDAMTSWPYTFMTYLIFDCRILAIVTAPTSKHFKNLIEKFDLLKFLIYPCITVFNFFCVIFELVNYNCFHLASIVMYNVELSFIVACYLSFSFNSELTLNIWN